MKLTSSAWQTFFISEAKSGFSLTVTSSRTAQQDQNCKRNKLNPGLQTAHMAFPSAVEKLNKSVNEAPQETIHKKMNKQ